MVKRWWKVGVVVVVVAVVASSGWSQERPRQRGFGFMRLGEQGEYISVVLLLDEETSEKVKAVYEEEGAKYAEAMREIRQSGGGDREARMAKSREEREKSAERVKARLKGILSEGQITDIEPILTSTPRRQDAFLRALGSLKLTPDQRARMLAVTVPYAVKMGSLGSRRPGERRPDQETQREGIRKRMEDFKKAAGSILTAEQKEKWEKKAADLEEQWQKEREQRRQRTGQQQRGERQGRRQ